MNSGKNSISLMTYNFSAKRVVSKAISLLPSKMTHYPLGPGDASIKRNY